MRGRLHSQRQTRTARNGRCGRIRLCVLAVLAVPVILCASLASGCTGAPKSDAETSATADGTTYVERLYAQILEQTGIKNMTVLRDSYIKTYYRLDPASFREYLFASASGTSEAGETVILVRCRDRETMRSTRAVFEETLATISAEAEDTDFSVVVQDAVIDEKDDLVYFIISPQADTIVSIIQSYEA